MKAILTFHSIDDTGSVISFPVHLFSVLLRKLKSSGIPVISLGDLLNNKESDGVVITFDDGMYSVYQDALPILKEHQVPAHIFLTTSAIEKGGMEENQSIDAPKFKMLNWDEVGILHENNIFIDAHTHSHPDLRALNIEEIEAELAISNNLIKSRVGTEPRYFAYPFGYHNNKVREAAGKFYKASVTTELNYFNGKSSLAALPRLDSFYFRSEATIKNLDSILMWLYINFRSLMRDVKGSQCKAARK